MASASHTGCARGVSCDASVMRSRAAARWPADAIVLASAISSFASAARAGSCEASSFKTRRRHGIAVSADGDTIASQNQPIGSSGDSSVTCSSSGRALAN